MLGTFMKEMDAKEIQRIAVERQTERMADLKERLPKRQFELLEHVPPAFIGRLSKVLVGTTSKKMIIRAMCEQCVGWEFTTEQIGKCKSYTCALHPYRPHQSK
jgi:hypothetical protein